MFDQAKTKAMNERIKALEDADKLRFVINWRIPHSLFNVACLMFPGEDLQGIDWNYIFIKKDIGTWSHGGAIMFGYAGGL